MWKWGMWNWNQFLPALVTSLKINDMVGWFWDWSCVLDLICIGGSQIFNGVTSYVHPSLSKSWLHYFYGLFLA